MNGGQALMETLAGLGVGVCFSNPGTSEIHLVAALDAVPAMRGVLCLFEGTATGAADGFGRMAGQPAAVLLHLGPGLANGLANLHNARRAHTPLVALVGEHATYHKAFDAPLESDIDALAGTVSCWTGRPAGPDGAARAAAEAVTAARRPPGGVATLILPADVSWSECSGPARTPAAGAAGADAPTAPALAHGGSAPPAGAMTASTGAASTEAASTEAASPGPADPGAPGAGAAGRGGPVVPGRLTAESVARLLRSGEPCVLLLGGPATRRAGLEAASRVCVATGARMLCEGFPARLERGAGIPPVDSVGYLPQLASAQFAGARHLILAGAATPVTFFAYPGEPSSPVPPECAVHTLTGPGSDAGEALAELASLVASGSKPVPREPARPSLPEGALTGETAAAAIGALLPEGAIVSDEAITSGLWLPAATAGCPPHDWLTLTGGAIGQGLPLATGAAIASPGRRVIALEADGSAMYTISALWTHAREGLDITTVVFSNRSYAILGMELHRARPDGSGEAARSLLDLSRPALDFTAIATGLGVPATRTTTAGEFASALRRSLAEPGPHLIEAVLPGRL
jgi:acetolactate synthase I/II/III large subunit